MHRKKTLQVTGRVERCLGRGSVAYVVEAFRLL